MYFLTAVNAAVDNKYFRTAMSLNPEPFVAGLATGQTGYQGAQSQLHIIPSTARIEEISSSNSPQAPQHVRLLSSDVLTCLYYDRSVALRQYQCLQILQLAGSTCLVGICRHQTDDHMAVKRVIRRVQISVESCRVVGKQINLQCSSSSLTSGSSNPRRRLKGSHAGTSNNNYRNNNYRNNNNNNYRLY